MAKKNTLEQIKKFAVMATIAILFSVLSFSIADLILDEPEYNDFCDHSSAVPRIPSMDKEECEDQAEASQEFEDECRDEGGNVRYETDDNGCSIDYYCETCSVEYNDEREKYQLIMFVIVSLLGLTGIFAGIYIRSKDEVSDWLLSGFILGGLASIFIATISFFGSMDPVLRPIIIIAEIVLVVWLTMRIQYAGRNPKKK